MREREREMGRKGQTERREESNIIFNLYNDIKHLHGEVCTHHWYTCTCGLQYSSNQEMMQDERVSKLDTLMVELKDWNNWSAMPWN